MNVNTECVTSSLCLSHLVRNDLAVVAHGHFSHVDVADIYILILQKMIFLDTAENVADTLRPYWSDATKGRASVVQAVPDMLEIVPLGTSKGNGVRVLLDHLGVTAKEVSPI